MLYNYCYKFVNLFYLENLLFCNQVTYWSHIWVKAVKEIYLEWYKVFDYFLYDIIGALWIIHMEDSKFIQLVLSEDI